MTATFQLAPILENHPLIREKQDVWLLKVFSPEISKKANPGQFLMIRTSFNVDPLLPRPFSLCQIHPEKKSVSIVYKTSGPGTTWLSRKKKGELLPVLGPLGNPFCLPEKAKKIALVGGGIGVTPLISLGEKAFKGKKEIYFFLGLRDKEAMTVKPSMLSFVSPKRRFFSTDNGTFGRKGDIVEHLREFLKRESIDYIAACGPKSMLQSLQRLVVHAGIPAEAAVEEAMACGLGYCLGCSVAIFKDNQKTYCLACKDGPILPLHQLLL
jgi:dihydroorotate dehydrogenase electron transfer subunit